MKSQVAFLVGAVVLPLAACSGSAPAPAAGAPAADTPGYFVVPAAQLAHVEVVPVAKASWANTLRTTGTVDWDADHTTPAIAQVSGPVTRIAVDAGAAVKAGDPLLYVASPDISNAISTYRKAKNRLDLAQRALDRSKDLLEHKAIAQRDFESAQADLNDAATDVQTALQALKIFGVSQTDLDDAERQNGTIRPDLAMVAPLTGTVVQKLVMPGQLIQAGGTVTFVISDVSTVWVQGHVYERDLNAITVGDKAQIHNPGLTASYHGVVTYIDRLVDPATRTILVRIVTPNTDRALKKDLFVDVDILGHVHRDVLAVPVGAVLYDEQNLPFVYVQVETGKFAQRRITAGVQQDGQVEVRDGLTASDRVVSQGSLFLQFANSGGL